MQQMAGNPSFAIVPPMKKRHWFTNCGRLRLRYVTLIVCAIASFGVVGFIDKDKAGAHLSLTRLTENVPVKIAQTQSDIKDVKEKIIKSTSSFSFAPSVSASIKKELSKPKEPEQIIVKIKSGDTLSGALQRAGLSSSQAYNAVNASSKYLDPRKIKPGQVIKVQPSAQDKPLHASIELDKIKTVVLDGAINGGSEISASLEKAKIHNVEKAASGEIKISLYGSAAQSGVPSSVIANLIRIYSWDVDFQRDIRAGDKFEVLYTQEVTEDGNVVGGGDILYAKLVTSGLAIKMYRFEDEDGVYRYFDENGHGIKKALMKTPVDGARISSGYGMRRHPVSGYSKMHKGIDFAAPAGTPIYAAGDGVVERANRFSTYGNYVKIRHAGGLETAYAHMRGFAKGVHKGTRVQQGQVIGYIGTTGRSTGPHLHYEVLKSGKQVNPAKVKQPVGGRLKGAQLASFKKKVSKVDIQYASLLKKESTQIAKAGN